MTQNLGVRPDIVRAGHPTLRADDLPPDDHPQPGAVVVRRVAGPDRPRLRRRHRDVPVRGAPQRPGPEPRRLRVRVRSRRRSRVRDAGCEQGARGKLHGLLSRGAGPVRPGYAVHCVAGGQRAAVREARRGERAADIRGKFCRHFGALPVPE